MSTVDVRPFVAAEDAAGVARLAAVVDWPSLTDPGTVAQVCDAPGSVANVAVAGGDVVGWAQALTDGVLQAHLGFLAVRPDHRRRGIGRLLLVATFQATGAKRLDLLADVGDAVGFYERFDHQRFGGFRLYPGA